MKKKPIVITRLLFTATLLLSGGLIMIPVHAGPITGGPGNPPFTKLGVYQGVVSIIPDANGDLLEIGNVGRDIAGTGDIFIRPGSTDAGTGFYKSGSGVTVGQSLYVSNKIQIGGLYKDIENGGDGLAVHVSSLDAAIYGEQNDPNGWAGYFSGDVSVTRLCFGGNEATCRSDWPVGGGGGVNVRDDGGASFGPFTTLDFDGNGVEVTDIGGGIAHVAIPGGGTGGVSGTPPQIAYFDTASSVSSANIYQGVAPNNYIGINRATPGQTLDVNGNIRIEAVKNCNSANKLTTNASGDLACAPDNTGGGSVIAGTPPRLAYFDTASSVSSANIYQGAAPNNFIGIASSSPTQMLDINGGMRVRGLLCTDQQLIGTTGDGTFQCVTAAGTQSGTLNHLSKFNSSNGLIDSRIIESITGGKATTTINNAGDVTRINGDVGINIDNTNPGIAGYDPVLMTNGDILIGPGTTPGKLLMYYHGGGDHEASMQWLGTEGHGLHLKDTGTYAGQGGTSGAVNSSDISFEVGSHLDIANADSGNYNYQMFFSPDASMPLLSISDKRFNGVTWDGSNKHVIYAESTTTSDRKNALMGVKTRGGSGSAVYGQLPNIDCGGNQCAAIWGSTSTNLSANNWAGYFDGNVNIMSGGGNAKLCLNGRCNTLSVINVCAVNGGACLGQYLGTFMSGGTSSPGSYQYCYYASSVLATCVVAAPGGTRAYELRPN